MILKKLQSSTVARQSIAVLQLICSITRIRDSFSSFIYLYGCALLSKANPFWLPFAVN